MAANIFGRYVWLIEQFRRYGRLTYEEVNDLWHRSGLSYGDDDDLALRTFHNHRKAIFDIFEVELLATSRVVISITSTIPKIWKKTIFAFGSLTLIRP